MKNDFQNLIDFTDLRPEATRDDIKKLCDTALERGYYSVCVNPMYLKLVKEYLGVDKRLKICCVIGYPLGANHSQIKLLEAEKALMDGVDELDVVMCIGEFKSGNLEHVKSELDTIVNMCKNYEKRCKIIVETGLLNYDERMLAAKMVYELSSQFSSLYTNIDDLVMLKTCTSSKYGPVNLEHVREIRKRFPTLAIKASGGIQTIEMINQLLELGVKRIGTSSEF